MTNEAKYLPAGSLMTVTLDGTHGSGRDQRTDTSPTLGRRSLRPGRILKRALAVNRMACRRSLRDRNRGGLIFGPFRSPLREAKKFRVRGVQVGLGLLEHHRRYIAEPCSLWVTLAAVSLADSSASVI
jgi:hypothetical protein